MPSNSPPLTTTQQVNQATSNIGTGLGVFGAVMGCFSPSFGQVTRFSPVHAATTVANIATTDTSSLTDSGVAMASSYAFVGQFIGRGAMRFAPVVSHALLARDVANVVGPAMMNQLDARAQAGCRYSREAVDSIRDVARRADERVMSAGQAYRVFQAREAALPPFAQSTFTD